jgi:amino acid transporter
MPELKRDLGLTETVAISMGAMVGSGIFILPGVAYLEVGTASVVLAFLLGAILTVPAALSAAELGTAIPEDGGSYLYVERGMGPMLGCVAGVGNWLMLNFKTALALVGGVPYLIFVIPSIQNINLFGFEPIVLIAVLLSIFFTFVNVFSTDSAGSLQNVIVLLMLLAMGLLVIGSLPQTSNSMSGGVFDIGGGFISATALVFVSYAGVIKVTSVAEEIKNPGKTIPRAIIISLSVTTFVYVLITYITVSVLDIPHLIEDVPLSEGGLASDGSGAIIAILAEETLGQIGAIIVVISALLALASTANSGILSASRYPFSMARDNLAPSQFKDLSERFGTPVLAVLSTGLLIILMVMFFPIEDVARLGGAFQVIIFMLVCLSVIGFREGPSGEYNPDYLSPFYPWLQLSGIIGGLILLLRIGEVALVGSLFITLLSLVYYFVYARKKVDTEGAVKKGVRERMREKSLEKIRKMDREEPNIMIVMRSETSQESREKMIEMAGMMTSEVELVEVDEKYQTALDESHPNIKTETVDYDNVNYTYIESQKPEKSIVDFATYNNIDLLIHEYISSGTRFSVIRDDIEWILEHSPCDCLLVNEGSEENIETVSLVSTGATFNTTEVLISDIIANQLDCRVDILQVLNEDEYDEEIDSTKEYHNNIIKELEADAESTILKSDQHLSAINRFISDDESIVVSRLGITTLRGRISGGLGSQLVDTCNCTCSLVYSEEDLEHDTMLQRLLIRYVFPGM